MRRICGQYRKAETVPWPAGLSYPLSRHMWVPSGRATTAALQGWPQEFRVMDVGSGHRHAQWSEYRLRPPGCSSCLTPLCPGRWGCVQWRPPQTGLWLMEQSARLPFPVHSGPVPRSFYQGRPDAIQRPTPHPALEGPMRWCCRLPTPGASGSTGTRCAVSVDNAFQHLPLVRPLAPPGFGRWVQLLGSPVQSIAPKGRPEHPK